MKFKNLDFVMCSHVLTVSTANFLLLPLIEKKTKIRGAFNILNIVASQDTGIIF